MLKLSKEETKKALIDAFSLREKGAERRKAIWTQLREAKADGDKLDAEIEKLKANLGIKRVRNGNLDRGVKVAKVRVPAVGKPRAKSVKAVAKSDEEE